MVFLTARRNTLFTDKADVVIVGAGHAGIEAALACAQMGAQTILVTMSLDTMGNLPCNPSIGGTAKGHLVREVDALGGFMGIAADHAMIQSRMLNKGKGYAVQSLRDQVDRSTYQIFAKNTLEKQKNLQILQSEVKEVLVGGGEVCGIKTVFEQEIKCRAVIIATGTFLNSKIHIGLQTVDSGPENSKPSTKLTDCMKKMGIVMRRFKTGTPARVKRDSIAYEKLKRQQGDEPVIPFSFMTTKTLKNKVDCYIAQTNEKTHEIIQKNIQKSAIYSGKIESVGPRYCPSIEDKIVRFPDKDHHQIFVEPCGMDTEEMYLQGMSSSLPLDVQYEMYRTIEGFEKIEIMRPAYAIEYDCIDPTILEPTLECRLVSGLFTAGQINGTSGYEEAAGQGVLAGINAVKHYKKEEKIILSRTESYIGTLIDDIVTKGVDDPYRVMTSRSEYRLSLRQDNADERLTPIGREYGLVDDARWTVFCKDREIKQNEMDRLAKTTVRLADLKAAAPEGAELGEIGGTALELMRRPYISYELIAKVIGRGEGVTPAMAQRIETEIRYAGYIAREERLIRDIQRHENVKIPENFDYSPIEMITLEAREKLQKIRPRTLAQAGRIPGVSPSDLAQLSIVLLKQK